MEPINFVYIPFLIILTLQLIFPFMNNLICVDIWLAPHYFFCNTMFVLSYFLFGVGMWESYRINNDKIFAFSWVLVFTNFIWIYYFRRNREISLIFLFISLLFGYFTYNSFFLSHVTTVDEETLYIDLYSIYMVWIGFMITILIETSPRFIKTKNSKKNKKVISFH